MVECKFSLELTKNGIQRSIHAKAGESNFRKLVITLTEAGKIFSLAGLNARIYLEDGKYIDDDNLIIIVGNTIEFIIPAALTAEEGIRFFEIKIFRGEDVLYSPMVELIVEKSFGNIAEQEALGKKIQYQELIATTKLKENAEISDEDSIVIYDIASGTVMRLTWAQLREIHNATNSHPIEVINGLETILVKLAPKAQVESVEQSVYEIYATLSQSIDEKATQEQISVLDGSIKQEKMLREASDNGLRSELQQKIKDASNSLLDDIELFGQEITKNKEEIEKLKESGGLGLTDEQLTELSENTKARHKHTNKELLDSFYRSGVLGLTFEGNAIAFTHNIPPEMRTQDISNSFNYGHLASPINRGYFNEECFKILFDSLYSKFVTNESFEEIIPKVTEDDEGKLLMVKNGAWAAVAVGSAEEAFF